MKADIAPQEERLRKSDLPSKSSWTKEKLSAGFNKFYNEFGRYPTALEIDTYEYLPTSRHIQRAFGGLVRLRSELGLEVADYTKGQTRSAMATLIGQRGNKLERDFEKLLVSHFGEHFVHVEKLLHNDYMHVEDASQSHAFKSRADFYVYAKSSKFCIDVFYAKDSNMWTRIVNIKLPKYSRLLIDTYLVNLNESLDIAPEFINKFLSGKRTTVIENIRFMNKAAFIELIKQIEPLHVA